MSNPNRPDLPEALLFNERTSLADQYISSAGYGAVVVFYLLCMKSLLRPSKERKIIWYLVVFVTTLFILGTLVFAGNAVTTIRSYVDNREYPGGPLAYLLSIYSSPLFAFGNAALVTQVWLSDGLMLYRLFTIYGHNWTIIVVPVLAWLSTIAVGILLLIQVTTPGSNFWDPASHNFAVPFYSLTVAVNILVPSLIVAKLLFHRRRTKETLGTEYTVFYVSISSMLVESAALTAVVSLLFIIPYARHSPISNVFQGLTCEIQIVASYLIIWRVAEGRAWTRTTADEYTQSMKFATVSDTVGSTVSNVPDRMMHLGFSQSTVHDKGGDAAGDTES